MVDDCIKHEMEILPKAVNLVPASERWIDLKVVDNGKSVIGRVGEEREDVYNCYCIAQIGIKKFPQYPQRFFSGFKETITVGDENNIFFVKIKTFSRYDFFIF